MTPYKQALLGLLFFVAALCISSPVHAEKGSGPTIAIVSPTASKPLDSIFESIRQGIASELGQLTANYSLKSENSNSVAALEAWLHQSAPSVVISLGRAPYSALSQIPWNGTHIVGGLFARPGDIGKPGVSLTLNPALMSRYLSLLHPGIKRIVVAEKSTSRSLVEQANQASPDGGVVIELLETPDADPNATLAREYWQVIESMKPSEDALWIDHRIDKNLLYELVKKAWKKNAILVSTNLSHADRGVLFSLYPDNFELGRRLAQIATSQSSQTKPQLEPLNTIKIAINKRVAEHVGIRIPINQFDRSKLLFVGGRR